MNKRSRAKRKNKGFTLLEVLLVMAILIILMSLVGAGYFTYFANSQEDACRLQMRNIEQAVKGYYMKVGQRPNNLQDLVQAPSGMNVQKWKGPYLEGGQIPKDPWGNEFKLSYGGDATNSRTLVVVLKSLGADGQEGGVDDITNQLNDPNNQ
ncbi:MAG: type II secretion system protein GspG [Planctomycetota bacterium]|jgi:general secretion pathway protein G|nr:type II secretion system protein GspG [Planctomycetota bacterium]